MNNYNSEVIDNFLSSEYALGELEKIKQASLKKEAQAGGGDNQLGVGPTQDEIAIAHPGGGPTTQNVNSGDQYNLSSGPIAGSEEAKIETIKEVHDKVMDVAKREKTTDNGMPHAHEASLKGFSKHSQKEVNTIKQAKIKLLNELVKIADMLEEKGLKEEVAQIDEIIKAETQTDKQE